MPGWLHDTLTNPTLTALLGVVVGAMASFLTTAWLVGKQRHDAHRAAARAVLYELTEIGVTVNRSKDPSLRVSTTTYDALVVPLYTELPDDVAWHVSQTYAFIHVFGPQAISLKRIQGSIDEAQAVLLIYARDKLKLRFTPPAQP